MIRFELAPRAVVYGGAALQRAGFAKRAAKPQALTGRSRGLFRLPLTDDSGK
jgi:hypothetical protein